MCKNLHEKTELNVLWHSTDFPSGLSFLCVFLCVWLWWIKTRLWDSLSALHSSLCARRLEGTVMRPALWMPVETAQFTHFFFPSGMASHSKIAQFNWECIVSLRLPVTGFVYLVVEAVVVMTMTMITNLVS